MKLKTITISILVTLFLIIVFQNTQVVSLRFLFWQISMSRVILMPIIMFIGFIVGFVIGRTSREYR